jgi:hypothetical protein
MVMAGDYGPSAEQWDYIMEKAVYPGQTVTENDYFEDPGYFC